MITTPIDYLASLRVGTVEFISPDRIEVLLDIEAQIVLHLTQELQEIFHELMVMY